MRVPYRFDRCVACSLADPSGAEHIIPRAIGGRLAGNLLCNQCNSNFGAAIVSKLKSDPSIRLAIENLQAQIPDLAGEFLHKAEYVGTANDGSNVSFTRTNKGFRILSGRNAEDLVVLPTNEALVALGTKLRRAGAPEAEIDRFQERFSNAAEDEPIVLPSGEAFIKRPVPHLKPNLTGVMLEDRFWALMGLEFVALVIGNQVLAHSFDPVRAFIRGEENSQVPTVLKLGAGREYAPFHALSLHNKEGRLAVQIRLFRWLTSEVIFDWIGYSGVDPVYFEDLGLRKSFLALDHERAVANRWVELP